MNRSFYIGLAVIAAFAALVFILFSWIGSGQKQRVPTPIERVLTGNGGDHFRQVVKGVVPVFPRDHGAHDAFRQEWWYFTGNLDSPDGESFGFQLTFFRFGLEPVSPDVDSAWTASDSWMAHFAIVDIDQQQFYHAEDFARGALGLADARADEYAVWVNGWSAKEVTPQCGNCLSIKLTAETDAVSLDLDVNTLDKPVLQGENGYSEKSNDGTVASYYYSYPFMQSSGTLKIGGRVIQVSGSAWMDREWSSAVLAKGQSGWDWFALDIDDTSRLVMYRVRGQAGDDFLVANVMKSTGEHISIAGNDLVISAESWWTSPVSGATYPTRFRIVSTAEKSPFDLTVSAKVFDQELDLSFRYYEGAVSVAGTFEEEDIEGRGYMELTGYENSN